MLDQLTQQPPDALLAIIKLFNADDRNDKIDLGVGVYRTADGATPVFRAVKAAEQRLIDTQDSKGYLGLVGDAGFVSGLMPYIFGSDHPSDGSIAGMQTPGGTGAVRLGAAIAVASGIKRMLIATPSWPNHAQILNDLGLEIVGFNHANADGTPDMASLRGALENAGRGDAILLHGCCHNPTGVDYSAEDWEELSKLIVERGVLPLVDNAYQGLGGGMEEDGLGLRTVLAHAPEALVAYSCDKNFGVYRDRVGAFYVVSQDEESTQRIMSNAFALARANWSMPPDHGGAVIRIILEDEGLTADWLAEVDEMRARIRSVRAKLADAGMVGSVDLSPLGQQNGMFATLPVTKDQVKQLREEHGVYMAGSGRINVAGLTMGNIDKFTAAIAAVTG